MLEDCYVDFLFWACVLLDSCCITVKSCEVYWELEKIPSFNPYINEINGNGTSKMGFFSSFKYGNVRNF